MFFSLRTIASFSIKHYLVALPSGPIHTGSMVHVHPRTGPQSGKSGDSCGGLLLSDCCWVPLLNRTLTLNYVYAYVSAIPPGGQKELLEWPEVEIKMVVRFLWVLGTESRCPVRAASGPNG